MMFALRGAAGVALAAGLLLGAPLSVLAQVSRVSGIVKDENGNPVRGATVVAENQNAVPPRYTAVTDNKGRYGMLGLRSGIWTFEASAPGFLAARGSTRVRGSGNNPPIDFRIVRDRLVPVGALGRVDLESLQGDLAAADDLMTTGKYDQAVARYEAILARVPVLTAVNLEIGRAHRASGRLAEALAAFERAATAEPPVERAAVEAGLTELALGRIEAAEARIAPLAARSDAAPEALYGLGEVKLAQADLAEATAWYTRAAEADPAWSAPHLKLGIAAARRGDAAAAVAHLEEAVALDPESPEGREAKALLDTLRRGAER